MGWRYHMPASTTSTKAAAPYCGWLIRSISTPDGGAVDLVLALALPVHHVQQHLELLAELAESFADATYGADLRAAPSIELLRRRLLDDDHPLPTESPA